MPDRCALSVVENNGFVYVWTGSSPPSTLPEDTIQRPEGFTVLPCSVDLKPLMHSTGPFPSSQLSCYAMTLIGHSCTAV